MRIGITGHRGLSDSIELTVRQLLRAELQTYDPSMLCGVSCIADGPDAWFAELVLELGGHVEVVVPAEQYREALPQSHHATYDALLARAAKVHSTGMHESTSEAHMAGSELMVGLVERMIAVWDGEPARGYGGTGDVVGHAHSAGVPVNVVWPEGATRD
ncbi:hypothetical protein HUT18_18685 [Streptomyces sp. NA04227]|uniref:hypothetical protein n=1 Tax=Streptomyces sp. NA04227 TaxID=2742136 RepID=UPI00158FC506|nr:hypothetical protein [Streptomyces sp. NA04227]QKW08108.1 hypothetical protein HUT18_18685 [Streptomyces sp. NA04227]